MAFTEFRASIFERFLIILAVFPCDTISPKAPSMDLDGAGSMVVLFVKGNANNAIKNRGIKFRFRDFSYVMVLRERRA